MVGFLLKRGVQVEHSAIAGHPLGFPSEAAAGRQAACPCATNLVDTFRDYLS